jgi:hypothetical protein
VGRDRYVFGTYIYIYIYLTQAILDMATSYDGGTKYSHAKPL